MTVARSEVVEPGVEMSYHCISRCVRRAFLCGIDSYTGKSYEHRKAWVKDRLKELSDIFAIDICGYAVMSNHLHLILRTRPDLEKSLTDKEVGQRWQRLFSRKQEREAKSLNLNVMNNKNIIVTEPGIGLKRSRLGSISWFMRCINEYIAKKSNREDDCKGRFWEGRFKCQALLDEAAELACLAYVDLNPVRSKQAKTLEKSHYTSVAERITAFQAKEKVKTLHKCQKARTMSDRQKRALEEEFNKRNNDKWLSPVGKSKGRKGFLSMTLKDYLELLDWTGRIIRSDKPGSIPDELLPVLKRLEIDTEHWVETVVSFGKLFYQVAGKLQNIVKAAKRAGRKWLKGISASVKAFPEASS